MKRKITRYIKPSFFVFLLVAALLWYGNKLEGRYTTDVMLPIEIRNDYSSRLWIEHPMAVVGCRVEGIGGKLLAYRTGAGDRVVVPMSHLTLVPVRGTDRLFRIDKASLTEAISGAVKDLRIQQILDTALTISVSPVERRRMPIESRMDIQLARQYMLVGGVRLTPDSVDVRGPRAVLDSMRAIYTRSKRYRDLRETVSGRIDLEQPENVILSDRQVDYRVDVLAYTQQTLELPVRVANLPEGWQGIVVPSRVTVVVNVPLRDYERIREERLHASVDYRAVRDDASGKYAVQVDSLPSGTEIVRIDPQFVEPFFSRR